MVAAPTKMCQLKLYICICTYSDCRKLTTNLIMRFFEHIFQQFDAMCKAEVAFFIARAFINVSKKYRMKFDLHMGVAREGAGGGLLHK